MIRKILEVGHNVTKKHWIVYTIITFIPTIWFSMIIGYFGETLGLVQLQDDIRKFTTRGIIITTIVLVIPLLISIINNWYASKSETSELEKLHNEKNFYEQLNKSIDYICEDKLKRLSGVIYNIENGTKNPPEIVSDPTSQLKRILEQINECLCVFMSQPDNIYKHKDFFITLAYRFPQEDNEWIWLDRDEDKGLTLEVLTKPENKSTFNHIIEKDKPYYFNNKKEDAKQCDRYLYDSTDEINADSGNDVGSIFCCRFQTKKSRKVFAEAIVSVSTYKKRFYNSTDISKIDEVVKENLLSIVRDYFGKRIGIELNLLYLEYLSSRNY